MPQRPKNVKVVIDGDEPKGVADGFAQAQHDGERRAKIDAAVKEIMSKNAKLLRKLAE